MNREILMSPALSGLSVGVTKLQAHLHGSLPWLEKSYGLATDGFRINQEKLTLTIPEVYIGNGRYHEVLPDGKKTSQVFYYADSAETVVDEQDYNSYRMRCRISIVVWVDLDKLAKEMGYEYSHRYTDELKKETLNALNSFSDYRTASIENRTKEIWKNWTVGRGVLYYGDSKEYAMTQILKHPEAGFRIYGDLYYEELCETYTLPIFGDGLPVTITNRNGEIMTVEPGGAYQEAAVDWPEVTNRLGEILTLLEGQSWQDEPIAWPTLRDRAGDEYVLYENDRYVEPAAAPVTIINPNDNTEVQVGEGEEYVVPLVTVQDVMSLDFNFLVDHDNTITATIATGFAATYTAQTLTNVATVTYKKNGTAAMLPITLVAGNTLEVTIARTTPTAAAKVILNS